MKYQSNKAPADYFVMPNSIGQFTSPGQQTLDFGMNFDNMQKQSDEWMQMSWSGT